MAGRPREGSPALFVGVSAVVPALQRGLTDMLAPDHDAVEAADLEAWLAGDGCRVGVLAVESDGIGSVRALRRRRPSVPLVVLLPGQDPERQWTAFRAGAQAVDSWSVGAADLSRLVDTVAGGRCVIPTALARTLAATPPAPSVLLDDEDLGRLRALAAGTTVARLAAREGYSEREMYRRLARLYERLGAQGRIDALVAAARMGYLE